MDASYIIYTGIATEYVPIEPGEDLQTILQNIDVAINSYSSAPDYTGYDLACITQTDGSSHPTNTQNFAEGISKIVCDNRDLYDTFVDTTYVTDQGVLTTAINGLQSPEYTYSPFSITDADGINTVWSKTFTGLSAIIASISPESASWSTLSITPDPTTIVDAFDDIIDYVANLSDEVVDKQDDLGTFDTDAIGGQVTDEPADAINTIIDYVETLPVFSTDSITWDCVTSGSTLQETIDNILITLNATYKGFVSAVGTGLTLSTISCGGRTVEIDDTWDGLYKVKVDEDDVDPDFLEEKIESSDSSITITNTGSTLDLSITDPPDGKVKVTSLTTSDYLNNVITTGLGTWGLGIGATVSGNNLELNVDVISPGVLIQNIITRISSDEDLLAQFCALVTQCTGCQCAAPTGFTVVITDSEFYTLSWIPGASASSQTIQYRIKDTGSWVSNVNITPSNPISSGVTTAIVENLTTNVIYQFQVLSNCCPGTQAAGVVVEGIIYEQVELDTSVSGGGLISVDQTPMPAVDTITYRLADESDPGVYLETITATGTDPAATFTFVTIPPATYVVTYAYTTSVNGVNINSYDADQNNAWYESDSIIA